LLAITTTVFPVQTAFALIIGGEGNAALDDPGWPKGAAAIFNNPARIAWWEGPPFGGGQWHAECRGDATAFNAVIADFAKLDVKSKRVVIHDGVGRSFWLDPNREPVKGAAAEIDWVFTVWQPSNWERHRKLPPDLNPTAEREADKGPSTQLEVYTGGKLGWSDVTLPAGLEISDERLEAHGFTLPDGVVLEGKVVDLSNKRPVAATVRLQRIEPQPKGGYHYTVVVSTAADDTGHWVLKKTPAGWHRVVIEADGYVSRVVGYARSDSQPYWHSYDFGLSQPAPVSGRITDGAGKPLEGVEVRLADVASDMDGRYEAPHEYTAKTDADGHFRADQVPIGNATIRLRKSGYCRPGLGQPITTPTTEVALNMVKSVRVRVTVDFASANRPTEYIVNMEPEGGAAIGKWSGSSQIDSKNQVTYNDVPPGRYVLQGRPNPSTADPQSKPLTIELKGGETIEATLSAK
jgi:hypothetical protein